MTVSEDDWEQVEAESHAHGVVLRRLYPACPHDIFLAVTQPGGRRTLTVRVPSGAIETVARRVGPLTATRGLELQFASADPGTRELRMMLSADDRRDVFNPLISDMAAAAAAVHDPVDAIMAALDRFAHWRHLLQAIVEDGLPPESRRGLYGELLVLRDHLLPLLPASQAVPSWTGPSGADQDFQLERLAIEVKTGAGRLPQHLVIANERQLDRTGTGDLLLTHVAVDERRGGTGESLNAMIESIRQTIGPAHENELDDRLARVGYLAAQRHLYVEPRYTVRDVHTWHVSASFPRITPDELRPGVGHVRYQVSTVGLEQYLVVPSTLGRLLKGSWSHD